MYESMYYCVSCTFIAGRSGNIHTIRKRTVANTFTSQHCKFLLTTNRGADSMRSIAKGKSFETLYSRENNDQSLYLTSVLFLKHQWYGIIIIVG